MSFAALRRLRRRFGISNAAKVVEASRYLHEEISDRAGHSHGSIGSRIAALLHAAGVESSFGRELRWATSLGQRALADAEPTDAEVDRFFDAVERLYGADLAEPIEPRDLLGRVVGDRYRIEALVGEGAAGVVYRARHVETDAPVAVKLLHPSKVLRREVIGELEHPRKFWEELVARFRREARAAANVSHPGIVSVFDFGAEGAGFYQAMEYLSGETLKEAIAREAPMAVERAAKIAYDAAVALDAAHARGVVHRDLKPANLFLCRFDWGEVLKVLDFGIAKMVRDAEEEATRLTETGVFLGTYRYASPEQCLGERVTPASDVYSLGVILFEMLTARPPFDGPSSVLAIRHATAPAPRVDELRADLPEPLADLVARALDKLPSRRPQQGGQLAAALLPFLATPPAASIGMPHQPRGRRAIPADAFAEPAEPRAAEPRAAEPRAAEPRAPERRSQERRVPEPRASEPRSGEHRAAEPRGSEPRVAEPRATETRHFEPRSPEQRAAPPVRPRPPASPTSHGSGVIAQGAAAFANTLIDDLLRMHRDTVAAGRAHRDIYRRLYSEIDMLWALHAKQFPHEERDYFHELLVERVADGDPAKLGPGFPDTTTQLRRRRKRGQASE